MQQPTHFKAQLRDALRKPSSFNWLIVIIFAILVPMICSSQAAQPSPIGTGSYTLKINGDMVILNATVLDPYDTLVAGLNEDAFQVYEDGVLQRIQHFSHEDIPVTVGILVDNSGSMGSTHADVVAAAMAFAHSSNPHDQMFVVNFGEHASLGLPADMPFTDRPDQLEHALSAITATGPTALYDGVAVGLDHLKQGDREKKVLILISDGGDNASQLSFAELIALARQSGVTIYAIGVFDKRDGDWNPGVLRRLATETGGQAFFPQSSVDIAPLCEAIARRIRNQYTLSYIPANAKRKENYRFIEVRASEPDLGTLSVRTRPGYSMPSATMLSAAN